VRTHAAALRVCASEAVAFVDQRIIAPARHPIGRPGTSLPLRAYGDAIDSTSRRAMSDSGSRAGRNDQLGRCLSRDPPAFSRDAARHLGKSFWFDESFFVAHYVREGPRAIITGTGLSHELYGLLAWATGELVGESEMAYRLLSAVPFVVGVVLVTAWLHRRIDAGSGLLYLFLATVSPLLLDLTRQARGYGLAYLAMSIVIIAALEADRTGRTLPVAVMCVAGVLGAWTLPQVAIGFLATGAVLLLRRDLRWQTLVGVVASGARDLPLVLPHTAEVHAAAVYPDGRRISTAWLVTAPFDQILSPAFL
jgi:hypothetical protein